MTNNQSCKFDHSGLNGFLQDFVTSPMLVDGVNSTLFDYREALASKGVLDAYVKKIAKHSVKQLIEGCSRQAKIAFWLNAYNGLVLSYVIQHASSHGSLPGSIKMLTDSTCADGSVWSCDAGLVGGDSFTFSALEDKAKAFGDSRIHAAINCASLSCPNLRAEAYDETRIDEQLDDQLYDWLHNPSKGVRRNAGTGMLLISPIFDWHAEDFGDIAQFLAKYGFRGGIDGYLEYNWDLNAAPKRFVTGSGLT